MNTTITKQTEFERELRFLEKTDPNAYENLIVNVDTIYKMKLATNSETALLQKNSKDFTCYEFLGNDDINFREKYTIFAKAKLYLLISNFTSYAALFCVDNYGYIRFKKHFYDFVEIQEILWDYNEQLSICKPMYHVGGIC